MLPRARPILVLLGALALGATPARAQQPDTLYALRPGDKITVEVFTAAGERVDVVTGERTIDRKGDVYLPYVGTIDASGLDQTTLRELLVQEYGRFYDEPVVDVDVQLRVNVTGAVANPGQYFLDPTATVFDALASAGGANIEYAVVNIQIPSDQRNIRLVRDGNRQVLNFHPSEVTDETLAMRIRSGDWIHVPAETRTAVRDEILFWGSLVSFASGIVSLIVLIGR